MTETYAVLTVTKTTGGVTASGSVGTITTTPPEATISGTASVSAGIGTVTTTAPEASVVVSGDATATGAIGTVTTTSPAATVSGNASVSAAIATVTTTPPAATVDLTTSVTASGAVGTVTMSAPAGEVSVLAKDTILRVSFPTPSAALSGTQQFRVYTRYKKISNTDPFGGSSAYINFTLYESGVSKSVLSTSNFVYSTTGEVVTVDWNANLLSDNTGAGVELYIEGKAYQDRAIEIGAVEWAVRHGAVAQTTEAYVKVGGVWKLATPYVKVGGAWKQADPYVKANGAWKGT